MPWQILPQQSHVSHLEIKTTAMKKKSANKILIASILLNTLFLVSTFLPWVWKNPERKSEDAQDKAYLMMEDSWASRFIWMGRGEVRVLLEHPLEGENLLKIILVDDAHNESLKAWNSMFWDNEGRTWLNALLLAPAALSLAVTALISVNWKSRQHLLLWLPLPISLYTAVRWRLDLIYFDRVSYPLDLGIGLWLTLYALWVLPVFLLLKFFAPKSWKW